MGNNVLMFGTFEVSEITSSLKVGLVFPGGQTDMCSVGGLFLDTVLSCFTHSYWVSQFPITLQS